MGCVVPVYRHDMAQGTVQFWLDIFPPRMVVTGMQDPMLVLITLHSLRVYTIPALYIENDAILRQYDIVAFKLALFKFCDLHWNGNCSLFDTSEFG